MENKTANQNPKTIYAGLKIMALAMTFAPLVFLIIFVYLHLDTVNPFNKDPELGKILLPVAGILGFIELIIIQRFIAPKYKKIKTEELGAKLAEYRNIFIVNMAMYEGMALFFAVVYLLSGNFFAALGALVFILFMFLNFPSPTKISMTLKLSETEIRKLSN